MPSKYSSDHSKGDAEDLAERIGCHYRTEAIESMVNAFESQRNEVAIEEIELAYQGLVTPS